jgi:hypothetical protein
VATDDGAFDRWVEAFRRGTLCTTDVMGGVKLFEHNDDPLDEVRTLRRGAAASGPLIP